MIIALNSSECRCGVLENPFNLYHGVPSLIPTPPVRRIRLQGMVPSLGHSKLESLPVEPSGAIGHKTINLHGPVPLMYKGQPQKIQMFSVKIFFCFQDQRLIRIFKKISCKLTRFMSIYVLLKG